MGRRSSGAGQASRIWGGAGPARTPGAPLIAAAPALNYAETINDNMLVVVMIETVESVIAANEIANTFGLDVVIEGNNDLSKFSGFGQNDDRYEDLMIRVHDAALKAGKFYGSAGSQYLTGNILSPDTRLVQDGPAWDGYTPPAAALRSRQNRPLACRAMGPHPARRRQAAVAAVVVAAAARALPLRPHRRSSGGRLHDPEDRSTWAAAEQSAAAFFSRRTLAACVILHASFPKNCLNAKDRGHGFEQEETQ